MSSAEDKVHITLVKYDSGLGVPGIMPPKLNSVIEIVAAPETGEAKAVKILFEDNKEAGKKEADLTAVNTTAVLSLVDELSQLPMQEAPGGGDVFGANTAALVRKGKQLIWAYNPGAGGCGCGHKHDDEEDEEEGEPKAEFSVSDAHKAEFSRIVGSIFGTVNGNLE
ncbi:hypothetical protein GGI07_002341 [Coemansia sp. Benny D115]|nr:hypothetical protein GGI07_002341 [Coemansia sp. Benny D115]